MERGGQPPLREEDLMRRAVLLLVVLCVGFFAMAQDKDPVVFEKPFRPYNPIVVGQGGSFVANAYGLNAFFSNPAGLRSDGEFTLLSVNPWVYTSGEMLDFAMSLASGDEPMARVAGKDVTVVIPADILAELPAGIAEEIDTFVNEFIAEIDPDGTLTADLDEIFIPESWADFDPESIDPDDIGSFMPFVEDLFEANPDLAAVLTESLAGEFLPPGFPTSPKLRAGTAVSIGLIVKGFGLGFSTIVDANLYGTTVMTAKGEATVTAGFMAGYAHEFGLGDMNLKVGALVRPMFRVKAPVSASSLMSALATPGAGGEPEFDPMALLGQIGTYYGTALGIDVGGIFEIGPFAVGLSITDLFDTRFNYQMAGFMDIYDSIMETQSLPEGVPVEDVRFVIPMDIRVGGSFHPDLGKLSFLIDPTVHFEVAHFVPLLREAQLARDEGKEITVRVGDVIAVGAEVRLFRILALRAGYYQGNLSAGVGAHLLFLDVNVGAYVGPKDPNAAIELSESGTRNVGNIGLTAEVAIRF